MPRSGTKLLRDLLNRHPDIAILELETEFFPYWAREWHKFGDLRDIGNFERFVHRQQSFPFFVYCRKESMEIDVGEWHRRCSEYTPAVVFEQLVHLVTGAKSDSAIWGDKSPSYTGEMPLLREHFANAKFVHILRDPRDYCLSINRAWGKSITRAAVRWRETIKEVQASTLAFAEDILHVKYEDLLSDPKLVLEAISEFLGVPFNPVTLSLAKPSENIGDAKGMEKILVNNTRKFKTHPNQREIATIEAICCEEMLHWGYDVGRREPLAVPRWKMAALRLADGANLVRADARTHGLIGAIRMHLGAARIAATRRLK